MFILLGSYRSWGRRHLPWPAVGVCTAFTVFEVTMVDAESVFWAASKAIRFPKSVSEEVGGS